MKMSHSKHTLAVCITMVLSTYSTGSYGIVCTDPTAVSQTSTQTALQEKSSAMSQYIEGLKLGAMEVYGEWKNLMSTKNEMASIQKINKAKTDTANISQQSRMKANESTMCDAINNTALLTQMLDDYWCEANGASYDFAAALTSTNSNEAKINASNELAKIIEKNTVAGQVDPDSLSLSGIIPGMGEAGYSKTQEEADRINTLLQISFNVVDMPPMPTDENSKPISQNSSPDLKRSFARWQKNYNRTMAGFNTASRVNNLTNPRVVNGQTTQSILENIKGQVDYYSSEEMIKRIGNGNDKSCFTSKAFTTEVEKQAWMNSSIGKECLENFTTPEEVQRLAVQLDSSIQNIMFNILESNLSIEYNAGLQTQILNEINSRDSRMKVW